MDSVKVKRLDLLAKVRENRATHAREYGDAKLNYFSIVEDVCQKNIEEAKAGNKNGIKPMPPAPVNYLKEYDRALAMLEMSVENELEIDAHTFNQLVMDEWTWTQSFKSTNTMYASMSGAGAAR